MADSLAEKIRAIPPAITSATAATILRGYYNQTIKLALSDLDKKDINNKIPLAIEDYKKGGNTVIAKGDPAYTQLALHIGLLDAVAKNVGVRLNIQSAAVDEALSVAGAQARQLIDGFAETTGTLAKAAANTAKKGIEGIGTLANNLNIVLVLAAVIAIIVFRNKLLSA